MAAMVGGIRPFIAYKPRRLRSRHKSRPYSKRLHLPGRLSRPVFVRRRTRRARMKNFPDPNRRISQDAPGPFLGKVADADQPFRLKNLHYSTQVAVTSSKKRRDLRAGQFVGGQIPAVLIEERQGTIIGDEVVSEKIFGRAKSFRRQAPQPSAADFGARARKTFDRTLRMFTTRLADRRFDPHPIAHRVDFAKRHTALHHAERAGVHAEEKDTFEAGAVLADIRLARAPRVIEWIVNMCGGRERTQAGH